jgi:hypothetical protein
MRTLVTLFVFALVAIPPNEAPKVPLSLAVVATFSSPEGGTIEMAHNPILSCLLVLAQRSNRLVEGNNRRSLAVIGEK